MIAGSISSRAAWFAVLAWLAPAQAADSGLAISDLDPAVPACQDFNQHANGGWLARNPVPPAYSSWSTFNEIEDRNNERLLRIAREAAAQRDAPEGSPQWLVGRFFRSATDAARLEALRFAPIQSDLDAIAAIRARKDLQPLIQRMHRDGLPVLFHLVAQPDLKDPDQVIAYAFQGGLGLPNRDFYLRHDGDSRRQREAYREHIARMLALAGSGRRRAQADAARIVELETRLAQAHLTREELRDPARSYHLRSVAEANAATPGFDWRAYLDGMGLAQVRQFSLSHPDHFAAMAQGLAQWRLSTWRAYLRWQLLRQSAPFLHAEMVDESFRFYGATLRGQKRLRPREIRAIEQMNLRLGEPLGRLFVERHFRPEAKAQMLALVAQLRSALRLRIEALPWLSAGSRAEALGKWASFGAKIGYPDRWRDHSGLRLAPDTLLANVRALDRFRQAQEYARVGRPADRSEWYVAPQQVNAYYNPLLNEVVFPAGILQPPFFDPDADDALNYGAIGAVIGHELMHAFDDAGSRFDAQGRLRDWWSARDRAEFGRRAQRLVAQASEFAAPDGLELDGKVSLGENIADLGGVSLAYQALASTTAGGSPAIDGYTPQQRFFLGWARVWRRNWTPEALRLHIQTGPHAPGAFRVNAPLANMAEFQAAFGCKAGDSMVRDETARVEIW